MSGSKMDTDNRNSIPVQAEWLTRMWKGRPEKRRSGRAGGFGLTDQEMNVSTACHFWPSQRRSGQGHFRPPVSVAVLSSSSRQMPVFWSLSVFSWVPESSQTRKRRGKKQN